MTASLVAAYVAAVIVFGPRVLSGRAWTSRSPGLAILSWYAMVITVLVGLTVAVAAIWIPARTITIVPCMLAGHGLSEAWKCWAHVLAGIASGPNLFVVTGLLVVLAYLCAALALAAWRDRRRRIEHAELLRLVGRPGVEPGVVVIDHDHPTAYTLAGRAQVVVTTGAVRCLTTAELAAVVAHERAHAHGHHHLIVDGVRRLSEALPRSRFLAQTAAELRRLVEMLADDVAVRSHSRLTLARALVAMAQPSTPGPRPGRPLPVPALRADGGDVMTRLRRLLDPPAPLRGPGRIATIGASILLPAVPMLTAILCAVLATKGCTPPAHG